MMPCAFFLSSVGPWSFVALLSFFAVAAYYIRAIAKAKKVDHVSWFLPGVPSFLMALSALPDLFWLKKVVASTRPDIVSPEFTVIAMIDLLFAGCGSYLILAGLAGIAHRKASSQSESRSKPR